MREPLQESATPGGQAAEWFMIIHAAEDPSAELVQQWLDWIEASDENRRAFEEVVRVWHDITPAIINRRRAASCDDCYDGSTSVAAWHAHAATTEPASGRRVSMWGQHRSLLAAAGALIICAILAFAASDWRVLPAQKLISAGHFETGTGEHLELLLADGSHVTLGAHSKLAVGFSQRRRQVRLESGEAFFSVEKDPSRPFEVLALDGAITAVGTAFNVQAVKDRVTVTVTEGAVRVAEPTERADIRDGDPIGKELRVAHGQQVSYRPAGRDHSGERARVKRVDAKESARWRDGWLVYRNEPLKYVVADIARYTNLKFTVTDPAAELQFSGAVFKDRVAEWIVALPEVSPVVIDRQGELVVISLRSESLVVQH